MISFFLNLLLFVSCWLHLEHFLDGLEALLPDLYLLSDFEPLLFADASDHGRLDDDLLVELVHFGVDDAMTHGLNDPLLYFVFVDIQQFGELSERLLLLLIFRLFNAANLYVLFLQDGLLDGYVFLSHQLLHFLDFSFELENILLEVEV